MFCTAGVVKKAFVMMTSGAFFYAWLFFSAGLEAGITEAVAQQLPPACTALSQQERQLLQTAVLEKVVDGDTLRLIPGKPDSKGVRVRLIGINTPELAQAQPLAREARQRLLELLAGDTVYLRAGEESHDRHGRLLAQIYTPDGLSIEALMLLEGWGFRIAVPPNLRDQPCLEQAEQQAREARRGVWGLAAYQALNGADLGDAENGFYRVQTRISRFERAGDSWWLETDGQLVLRIRPSYQRYFATEDLQGLEGKVLVVRGWMYHRDVRPGNVAWPGRKSWVMELKHPRDLQQMPPD